MQFVSFKSDSAGVLLEMNKEVILERKVLHEFNYSVNIFYMFWII